MLSAHGLGVGVAGKRLLTGVDLEVGRDDVIAITGPSGCGKTTLLRTLVGLIDALEGDLRLEGRAPAEIGWPQFRRRVMFVAQRPVLFDTTVADNLRRPFSYATAGGRSFDVKRAEELMRQVGMPNQLEQPARTLSEGQAQRMVLVRALGLEPDVLLLDEPTSGLDAESRERVEALLESQPAGIVLVSHDPAQVQRLAARTLDLRAFAEDG